MRLAHLILSHVYPEHVYRLVSRLEHENTHFYIHVDKKTDIESFMPLAQRQNVFFIKKRAKVNWGSYSIVQAILNSFEEILASGRQYDYINLISGQDYPIKNKEIIHQFLESNPGKLFIQFDTVQEEWQEAIPRITRYHFTDFKFPGRYTAQRLINSMLPVRKLPKNFIAVGRSGWFTITPESIAYILRYFKKHPWVKRFFRLTWAPDEIIFQTILYNSHFKKDMVNDNLLYVDWSKGEPNPKVLGMEDADQLKNSSKLFARKFNPTTDSKILDYLDGIISFKSALE